MGTGRSDRRDYLFAKAAHVIDHVLAVTCKARDDVGSGEILKTSEVVRSAPRSPQTRPVGRISILRLTMVGTFTVPAMTTEAALNRSVVIDPFSPTVILSRPLILPSTWPSMMAGSSRTRCQ